MSEIFEMCLVTSEQVVIKVHAKDNFTIATHPYINGQYDYITVTRGRNHTLTVVNKDGTTFNFHWGDDGYTLISDNLERLRKEVINFIQEESHTLLEYDDTPADYVKLFYNKNFGKWQMRVHSGYTGCEACYWSKTATSIDDMLAIAKQFGFTKPFKKGTAVTGIPVWTMQSELED